MKLHGSKLKYLAGSVQQNGLDIENLPSYHYYKPLQNYEQNKVLQQNLWQFYTQKTWITPREPFPPRMACYVNHFVELLIEEVQRETEVHRHRHATWVSTKGQLKSFIHPWTRDWRKTSTFAYLEAETFYKVCEGEMERKQGILCTSTAYKHIREKCATSGELPQCQ